MAALYSVGTWDPDKQAYTPQRGLSTGAYNLPLAELRHSLRELRRCGYSAHRVRASDGSHEDNDPMVLVERTDGASVLSIRRGWRR